MTIDTQELRIIGRAYEPVSPSLSRMIVEAADALDLQTAQLAAQAAELARLREIVEMAAAGNTEYDGLQRQASVLLTERDQLRKFIENEAHKAERGGRVSLAKRCRAALAQEQGESDGSQA